MSWFFTSGGQSIRASASETVLPMNIQCWFPLGLTGLIALLSKWFSRVFFNTTVRKHHFFGMQLFYLFFLLKDNCFTEFCCFLSNLNMNQPFLWSSAHIHTRWLEKPLLCPYEPLSAKWYLLFNGCVCAQGRLTFCFIIRSLYAGIYWITCYICVYTQLLSLVQLFSIP